MGARPLDGVRILDFTWVVAGPVATRILGDHGAQVVKVERKDPPPMGNRKLGLQCDLHRSKLSVALNMQHPKGVELARRLAAISDIVMDNFSARVMRTWGMDYESLKAVKPDIICISMSGLGHTGPRSSYVSYGPTLQALTGYTQLMAEADGTPAGTATRTPTCAGDTRARSQRWSHCGIDGARAKASSSICRSSRRSRASSVPRYSTSRSTGARSRRRATIHRRGRPRRMGFTNVARSTATTIDGSRSAFAPDPNGARFVVAIGSPEWASEPKFRTLYMRMQNSAELDVNVSRWTAEHSAEDAMAILQRAGIAAGVVENGVDLCARDPQLKERGFWPEVSTRKGVATHVTGIPFKLSGGSGEVRTIAPEVGEDFDYVLGRAARPRQSSAREVGRGRRRLALIFATSRFFEVELN